MKSLYFLLDISASMSGERISSLNDVLENLSAMIADEDVSVRIMTFSRTAQWLTDSPVPISEFNWQSLAPYGMTAMGAALSLLDRTLRGQEKAVSDTTSTTTSTTTQEEELYDNGVVDLINYYLDSSTMAESVTDVSLEPDVDVEVEPDLEQVPSSQKLSEAAGNSSSESNTNSADGLTIILITDGYPTDDFESAITALNANEWFQKCTRLAIPIGDEADQDTLLRFTSDPERIYPIGQIDLLEQTLVEILGREKHDSAPERRYYNDITEPPEYNTPQPTQSSSDSDGDEWG